MGQPCKFLNLNNLAVSESKLEILLMYFAWPNCLIRFCDGFLLETGDHDNFHIINAKVTSRMPFYLFKTDWL